MAAVHHQQADLVQDGDEPRAVGGLPARCGLGDQRVHQHLDPNPEQLLAGRDPSMTRSRTFELTALATVQLNGGDMANGIDTGHQAVTLATEIQSTRVIDRLAPLQDAAMSRAAHYPDARDLAQQILTLRAA
ncbi:hypothetical protein ACQPYK_49945 (plasmid) [Streptosporangium sp. CA-135522]|uniref:hypothetical protein n=1 Tax=Streptosporangium sp. CA-135522 TaxID=3240072 RepID=UPI003D932AA4